MVQAQAQVHALPPAPSTTPPPTPHLVLRRKRAAGVEQQDVAWLNHHVAGLGADALALACHRHDCVGGSDPG